MYNTLIIGCGNIGALYDFDNDKVLTHAKAFYNHPGFNVTVFDTDTSLAGKVAAKYQFQIQEQITETLLSKFDCVCICTPTTTHAYFLRQALNAGVKVIVCEKPVSNELEELAELQSLYETSDSLVLVNYIRRFCPAYEKLQVFVSELLQRETLTNVSIRYQRGFINNCSHALDLLQFITGRLMKFEKFAITSSVKDHFEYDPTLSAFAKWNETDMHLIGLGNVQFSHFEIDLYFLTYKIKIFEAGNRVEVYHAEPGDRFLKPLTLQNDLSMNNCIYNYMQHIANRVHNLLSDHQQQDNFIESINLNLLMLENLKKQYGYTCN